MNIPFTLSLNTVLMVLIGGAFIVFSMYHGLFFRDRLATIGLFATGIGCTFLGLTDGFTDPTPRGKVLYKIAVVAFVVGLPILAKTAWEMAK